MFSEEHFKNTTKLDINFVPMFSDCHLLPDISFNGHC